MKRMKESYNEEPATHVGPESCVPVREDRRAPEGRVGIEALTGGSMGRVLSRDRSNWGGRRSTVNGRQHQDVQKVVKHQARQTGSPAVLDLVHVWTHLTGNWEISCSALREWLPRSVSQTLIRIPR